MISFPMKPFAAGAVLLAGAVLASAGANAQGAYFPPGATVQSLKEDPAAALTRHLRALNSAPRNLSSLLGAGQAALDVGDPQTALTFFARAEEVAPRDGRVKAGMGSAFVQTEQAEAALRFFADAVAYGAPLALFAKDRGLAYDMIGDPVRAQADYAFALQRGSDAEVERRMALSKAISGDQKGALAVLDAQIRRGDRAGWRARAFVLALTGDAAGAVQAARSVMPAQASAMSPFFARLPQLSAADRAMAVHFGRFPTNWQVASAANIPVATPIQPAQTATNAGRPDLGQPALGSSVASSFSGRPVQSVPQPAQTAPATTLAARSPLPAQIPVAAQPQPQPIAVGTRVASTASLAAETAAPQTAAAQPAPTQTLPVQVAMQSSARLDFSDVVEAVESLPAAETPAASEQPERLAEAVPAAKPETPKPSASKPAKTAAKPAAKPAPKKTEPAKPKEPSRIWVQLAAAQDKSSFPAEFKRLKTRASELLAGKSAWTAPMGRTNRLLVGPFKTEKEAREFVNQLSKARISSFSWVSEEGQKVDKLPAK